MDIYPHFNAILISLYVALADLHLFLCLSLYICEKAEIQKLVLLFN